MGLTTISGTIQAQPLNDNFSYLNERKNDLAINVKDYGAIGDGIADDTAAIQAALNAGSLAQGGIVFFPEGTYQISNELTNNSANIMLCGTGLSSTIRQTVDGKHGINVGAHNGVRIIGLRLLTSGFTPTSGNGIHSDMAGDLYLERIVCQDFFNGFYIDTRTLVTQSQVYLISCEAYNNGGDGFYINRGTDVNFSNCRSLSNSGNGVYIFESSGLSMTQCLLSSNTGHGIKFDGVANNNWDYFSQIISDGNTQRGYSIGSSKGLQFSNCWAGSSGMEGFLVSSSASDIQFSNCQARNNNSHGFTFDSCANVLVDNCFGISNGKSSTLKAGFALITSANRIKITNCTAYDDSGTQAYGILTAPGVTNSVIENNSLYGNVTAQASIGSYVGNIIRRNHGFKTEASGSATVTAAIGNVVISHGLATIPTRVVLTPTSDFLGTRWWATNKASSSFTITLNTTISSNITFDWQAFVGEVDYS